MMTITAHKIKKIAAQTGFDLCGVTSPEIIPQAVAHYEKWLEAGYHAEMNWLKRNISRRTNPKDLMDKVNSVIMLGLNYYTPDSDSIPVGHGRVSKYARGKDYHRVFRKKIEHFLFKLNEIHNDKFIAKWWVDYGPFMERAYAVKAGLGYIGKNSMLINRDFGSWIFLAEIVTDLKIELKPANDNYPIRCGNCTLCIDACPTDAIVGDSVIDSNRCLSYVTVEAPENLNFDFQGKMENYIFGCDICQTVCPHNRSKQKDTKHKEFTSKSGVGEFVEIQKVLDIKDRDQFLKMFAGTPLVRPKEPGLNRNAKLLKNKLGT